MSKPMKEFLSLSARGRGFTSQRGVTPTFDADLILFNRAFGAGWIEAMKPHKSRDDGEVDLIHVIGLTQPGFAAKERLEMGWVRRIASAVAGSLWKVLAGAILAIIVKIVVGFLGF
jgi:hypothetical protein